LEYCERSLGFVPYLDITLPLHHSKPITFAAIFTKKQEMGFVYTFSDTL